jgi:hypothetical protein
LVVDRLRAKHYIPFQRFNNQKWQATGIRQLKMADPTIGLKNILTAAIAIKN